MDDHTDDCGDQNKNNQALHYLLMLVDSGKLKSVSFYFFIKGHTKNSCDRELSTMHIVYAKHNLYTMEQVNSMIERSSNTNTSINLEHSPQIFKNWKGILEGVYLDFKGIQKYQLFDIDSKILGVGACQKHPSSVIYFKKLRQAGGPTTKTEWNTLLEQVKVLPPVGPNAEKVADLH